MQVISTEGGIEVVSPNVVSIKVGGTELKITPEGVFITTPGVFRVKASEHCFEGGGKVSYKLPNLPAMYSGVYKVLNELGKPVENKKYLITLPNGQKILGATNADGETVKAYSTNPKAPISMEIIDDIDDEVWYIPDETMELEAIDDKEVPVNIDDSEL